MNGMEAGHLTEAQLHRYIRNELTPQERDQVDSELEICEGCLWRFMAIMEQAERMDEPWMTEAETPDLARMEEAVIAELMRADSSTTTRTSPFVEVAPAQIPGIVPHDMIEEAELQQQKKQMEPEMKSELMPDEKPQEQDRNGVRKRTARQRGSWLQHPVTHYTIAASITMLLLATGVLTSFSESLQQLNEQDRNHIPRYSVGAEWMGEPSWSDRLVDRAGSWLDGIQSWRFK